jgi:hypothetical protein
MDFLNWYKHMIESADQDPPSSAWEEIQNELDVEAVWAGINEELQGKRRKILFYRLSAAATLLLLITAGAFFFTAITEQAHGEFTVHDSYFQEPVSPYMAGTTQPVLARLAVVNDFPEMNHPGNIEKVTRSRETESIAGMDEIIPHRPYLEYNTDAEDYLLIMGNRDSVFQDKESTTEHKAGSPGGYYAGLSGHLGNTWLLNHKTLQGLRSEELTASLPSFGYSFGILAGKSVNDRLDIQAEAFFITRTSQNYNEYMHGQYINNSMQFVYSSITLSARWYFTGLDMSGRHSLLFGTYAGILRNALQDMNGESFSLKNEYNPADYGIITGYEYFHPLGDQLMLGTGFQTKFGMNNIFAGNEVIPYYLNNTRNASINLILSLRYNLK